MKHYSANIEGEIWLYVIGIGANGMTSLCCEAKKILSKADKIIGSSRQIDMLDDKIETEKILLPSPVKNLVNDVKNYHRQYPDKIIVILATGDPMNFGIGNMLIKYFLPCDIKIISNISAFSLAAARMLWPLNRCYCLSVHGRPIEMLIPYLAPERRCLLLAHDRKTPAKLYQLLKQNGYRTSDITILENMNTAKEKLYKYSHLNDDAIDDFHTIALDCHLSDAKAYLPPVAGLPSRFWQHDGKITKADVRALTICALSPKPDMLLWDIGAGAGSIAIELLRLFPFARAVAVEQNEQNAKMITKNAQRFGCHNRLALFHAEAPSVCDSLPPPDAIFIGGGLAVPDMIDKLISYLKPDGVCVANAVTTVAEQILLQKFSQKGGILKRIQIATSDSIGRFHALRPSMTVTQWRWCAE